MIEAYQRTGELAGACLCGDVTVSVNGSYVAAVGLCHCRMCQRWSGVAFGCFSAKPDAVTIQGEVSCYASSNFSERAFCRVCGSHLWMRDTVDGGGDFEFMPGLFPDAKDFPLISEIYTDQAPAYVPLAGAHKRATAAEYEENNRHVPEGRA